ncbi:hypothetical protein BD289DRAFT_421895 [Coniella lustricola]|uniref:Uncharacterized protein n=1 Tax=Coniella lustricola TaxID=2025994 RepID=A0A2T3AL14_9PEZI|nr:hypothetical protein BD289DRAFT_421895 [Coniella lustricola]
MLNHESGLPEECQPPCDEDSLDLSSYWCELPAHKTPGILRTTLSEAWVPPDLADTERFYAFNERVFPGSTAPPPNPVSFLYMPTKSKLHDKTPRKELQTLSVEGHHTSWRQQIKAVENEPDSPVPIHIPSPTQRRRGDIAWGWPWLDTHSVSSTQYHRIAINEDEYRDCASGGLETE